MARKTIAKASESASRSAAVLPRRRGQKIGARSLRTQRAPMGHLVDGIGRHRSANASHPHREIPRAQPRTTSNDAPTRAARGHAELSVLSTTLRPTPRAPAKEPHHARRPGGLERAERILHPLSAGFFSLRARVWALIAPATAPPFKPKSLSRAPVILRTGWPKRICAN
jgi:hypothetical protein